ncbi:MAG: sorbosone dehydrogenase family protein [Betaproteobacteria bacterium]|nr:sorbosone dehydrogenase family protein [Betaproteobacteria bacterium]
MSSLSRLLFPALLLFATLAQAQPLPLDRISLPPGFRIELYARVPGARSLALGDRGTLFVGTMDAGKVYAVRPGADGRAAEVLTIARGLNVPNGVAFRDGALYVAEIDRILRYDEIESRLENPPKPVLVTDRYPSDRAHGWKYIKFGPDGWLYVPVGAPCNVCEPDPDRYALISRIRPDGTGYQVFARGIRNSVGFDWHPETGVLWFNDHGRDWMGDDLPSCELNRAPEPGMNFGFPYCHQGDTPDPEFGTLHACSEFTPPAWKQGGHVAPDGLHFYRGDMFPPEYRNRAFIAQHGSWNRTRKNGYRVMMATIRNGTVVRFETFAQGWLEGQRSWGRPVDLLELRDGSLLVSDDQAGAIYRITYAK